MKFGKVLNLSLVALLLAGSNALANEAAVGPSSEMDADLYFSVSSVEVEEVASPELEISPSWNFPAVTEAPSAGGALDETNIILDQVINIGKKVWTIVEKNKPVVSVELETANALPEGVANWRSLSNWQTPQSKVYRVRYKNGYGMNVVDFSYRVTYTYGGMVNGKGLYLTNVNVVPAELAVAWGYKFSAKAAIPSVTNAGSHESPVGGMEIQVSWEVDTILRHMRRSSSFYVRGDGLYVNLTNGT